MNLAEEITVAVPETLPTRLLPDILEKLATTSPLTILDVGAGVHETVAFFGQQPCRLHFPALYEALTPAPQVAQNAPVGQVADIGEMEQRLYQAWLERFRAALDYPPETRFDLCLLWDFANYLDDVALRAFADALSPFVSATTLAHSYLLLKEAPDVLNRQYGVLDRDQISVRPRSTPAQKSFPRPQGRVISVLKDFVASHNVLRRDGLLEVSLKANR